MKPIKKLKYQQTIQDEITKTGTYTVTEYSSGGIGGDFHVKKKGNAGRGGRGTGKVQSLIKC